ncbi:coproporphyrinogen III oxidase [Escherichia albertii]|nr:coproporphyrinogen III oxidase [Escherichia albertii]
MVYTEKHIRIISVTTAAVTNGAIVIHTQRLKSDPGGNLLS